MDNNVSSSFPRKHEMSEEKLDNTYPNAAISCGFYSAMPGSVGKRDENFNWHLTTAAAIIWVHTKC